MNKTSAKVSFSLMFIMIACEMGVLHCMCYAGVHELGNRGDTRGVGESEESRQGLDREKGEAEEAASTGRDRELAERRDCAASRAQA